MNNVPVAAEVASEKEKPKDFDPNRIRSIDCFRGLVVLLALFLADLTSAHGIPVWLQPVLPASADFSLVDLVFPFFLFLVGLSIPVAVLQRFEKKAKAMAVWKHMLFRSFCLIVLGLFLVNMPFFHKNSSMPQTLWTSLFYVGALLIWLDYPATGKGKPLFMGLKLAGIAILAYLNISFRGGNGSQHMQIHDWGFLGLLAWAGLLAGTLYLYFQRNFPTMVALAALLLVAAISVQSGRLELKGIYSTLVGSGSTLTHGLIVMVGILAYMLFTGETRFSDQFRNRFLLVAALFLGIAGFLLQPLYGISRLRATPSWALYAAAVCCLSYLIIYFFVEVKGLKLTLLERAGRNGLLALLLWGLLLSLFPLLGLKFLDEVFAEGTERLVRSGVLALLVVVAAAYFSSLRIRVKL